MSSPQVGTVELVIDGLTFDLNGLKPATAIASPLFEHRYDFDTLSPLSGLCSLQLKPGPHLAGSAKSAIVVKAQMSLARALADGMPDLAAIGWRPARSVMSPAYFEKVVGAWLDGGPFPALGLTSFQETLDGGVQTAGLSYLTGQEIRIEPGVVADQMKAAQLAVRLVNQFVSFGTLTQTEVMTAPDGRELRLEPSVNGRFVRVWAG